MIDSTEQYEVGEYVFMNKDGRILIGYTPTTRREPVKIPSTDLTHEQQRAILAQIPANNGYRSSVGPAHHNDPGYIFPEPKDDTIYVPTVAPSFPIDWMAGAQVKDVGAEIQAHHRRIDKGISMGTEKVWSAYNAGSDPHASKFEEAPEATTKTQNVEFGDESIKVDPTLSPEGRIASYKQQSLKKRILAAYEAYQRKDPGSMNALVSACREFVYRKLHYHIESNPKFKATGTAETSDDGAQDVAIKIWLKLVEGYKGTAQQFYSYLNKAAFNERMNAERNVGETKDDKQALTVSREHEDGNVQTKDNPALYQEYGPEETPYPTLPKWIDTRDVHSIDAAIVRLMSVENAMNEEITDNNTVDATTRAYFDYPAEASIWRYRGFNYTEIAAILNLSTAAVKQRVKKMRDRMQKEGHSPWSEPLSVTAD